MNELVGNARVISYDCRYMQARHLLAKLTLSAVSLTVLLGCSTGTESAMPTSSATSTPTSTSTSASAARPAGLHTEWSAKFAATRHSDGPAKCTEARPKMQTCVDYLTEIVTLAIDLRSEISARPDAASYEDTLAEIDKITEASESYAKCTSGCYGDALAIGLAPATLVLRLQLEDPTP